MRRLKRRPRQSAPSAKAKRFPPVPRIAGVDEAGRGPWAGPVVAAAVILHRLSLPVRIDDSKRLSPIQRARAFDMILAHADVGFGIVCAEEIDRDNILRATLTAMAQAVRELPVAPERVLVDGAQTPSIDCPCEAIIRGDQTSYVISCASIMAKVLRDRLMEFYHELAPQYAFDQHKGYGTPLHAARLAACGPSVFHRRSFRPVSAVLASAAQEVVDASPILEVSQPAEAPRVVSLAYAG